MVEAAFVTHSPIPPIYPYLPFTLGYLIYIYIYIHIHITLLLLLKQKPQFHLQLQATCFQVTIVSVIQLNNGSLSYLNHKWPGSGGGTGVFVSIIIAATVYNNIYFIYYYYMKIYYSCKALMHTQPSIILYRQACILHY